jgi:hypothetical protein
MRRIPMAKSMPSENVETHNKNLFQVRTRSSVRIRIRNGLDLDPERIVSGFGTECIRIRNKWDPDPIGPTDPDLDRQNGSPPNEKKNIFYF